MRFRDLKLLILSHLAWFFKCAPRDSEECMVRYAQSDSKPVSAFLEMGAVIRERWAPVAPETGATTGRMKTWLQQHLPRLNELARAGGLRAESFAAILSSEVLTQLPPAEALNTRQAWQVLTILGCCGSSVERHAQ